MVQQAEVTMAAGTPQDQVATTRRGIRVSPTVTAHHNLDIQRTGIKPLLEGGSKRTTRGRFERMLKLHLSQIHTLLSDVPIMTLKTTGEGVEGVEHILLKEHKTLTTRERRRSTSLRDLGGIRWESMRDTRRGRKTDTKKDLLTDIRRENLKGIDRMMRTGISRERESKTETDIKIGVCQGTTPPLAPLIPMGLPTGMRNKVGWGVVGGALEETSTQAGEKRHTVTHPLAVNTNLGEPSSTHLNWTDLGLGGHRRKSRSSTFSAQSLTGEAGKQGVGLGADPSPITVTQQVRAVHLMLFSLVSLVLFCVLLLLLSIAMDSVHCNSSKLLDN
jgi:hypothetical protein